MPFKLTKDELATREKIINTLRITSEAVGDAVEDFNDAMATAGEKLQEAVAAYNEALETAREFASDIANQANEDFNDKSEKWQEGERGEAANEWIRAWDNLDMGELEIELPDQIMFEAPEAADELENAPEAAGE